MSDDAAPYSPQPGPQTMFCRCSADVAIMGGSAGGGKTIALLLEAARLATYEHAGGVLFRRTSPELTGSGSAWEEAQKIFTRIPGAKCRQSPTLEWRFPGGSLLEFRHLQYEADVYAHQGKQYSLVMFDELTHFEESQFFYLISRLRSTSGMRPILRATCNPDPDSFVRKLIEWWVDTKTGLAIPERSGVIRWMLRDGDEVHWGDSKAELSSRFSHLSQKPMSFTFIPSKLSDNPALLRVDPSYRARLEMLPLVERERLLGGNWNIRAAAGTVFKKAWFEIIDHLPSDIVATTRGWDLAATEPSTSNADPDWTRGPKVSRHRSGLFVVQDVRSARVRPHDVDRLVENTARSDGERVKQAFWQDPGAAGKSEAERYRRMLAGYQLRIERASHDKVTYAKPVSSQAEGLNVKLLRGSWNESFLNELEAFPDGKHDDQVDGLSLAFLDLTKAVEMQNIHVRGL